MSFYNYLESRYVTSQLTLQKKQTTTGHAHNHALLALMWISLKIGTLFNIFLILFHYLAVVVHLVPKPRRARDIATDAALEMQARQEEAAKVVRDITKGATDANQRA